jgi:3-hydroxybutyryl-CoA dehydrogenase
MTSQRNWEKPEVNDYPGFVANRILMPMINEAIETLYNKVAGFMKLIP